VPACTWAVFPNEGPFPATLQNTMARTYSEWLPSSDYEVIDAPSFSFTKMDEHKKDYAYSEIWLPVRKK
ncbi:MAG: GyrI-like domain-containing protein, partial [Clostridia bacterium]|nr:GyrI-like domain-containing protein [Clostridia bacterium]